MISNFSTSTICVNLHLGQKRGKFLIPYYTEILEPSSFRYKLDILSIFFKHNISPFAQKNTGQFST